MLRLRFGLVLGLASTLLLVACGGGTTTASYDPTKVSGTIRLSGWTSSPAEDKLLTDQVAAFQVKYPNIKVTYEPVAQDFRTKLKAQLASGTEPDVFYLELGDAAGLMSKHVLLDLRQYMAKTSTNASDFAGPLLGAFTQSGAIYGIPKDFNTLALFYNKDMFSAAGISEPTASWTWQDLADAAKKLTKAGVYGLMTPPDSARWAPFVYQNGGSILSSDNSKSALTDSAVIDATTFYTSFQKNGSGTYPAKLGAGIGWAGDAFAKGKSAMVMEGGWLIPFMKDYPGIKWNAVELPKGKTQGNLFFTVAYAASARTKNADASWLLINYLTSLENQKTVLNSGFALPTRLALKDDPFFAGHPASAAIFAGNAYAKPFAWGVHSDAVSTAIGNALERILLGKQTVQASMAQADKEVNDAIAGG
jgi:multiple sugar transport system substrate-binding protein